MAHIVATLFLLCNVARIQFTYLRGKGGKDKKSSKNYKKEFLF